MLKTILLTNESSILRDLGLLFLRVTIGLMMAFSHGLGKLKLFFSGDPIQFLDPIGIGAPASLFMAGFTEFVLSILLALGFLTRIISIPMAFTMVVAVFIVHANDPFNKMEFGLLYLIPYIFFIFTGPGKLSLDHMIWGKK